jgi:hypothetical protein
MNTLPIRTARYAMGNPVRGRAILVHQVAEARAGWGYGWDRSKGPGPHISARTLCGYQLGGCETKVQFAHSDADLPGVPCPRCALAVKRRRELPNWKLP